jgi:glutathione-regulated potassium-efflux system ancillary protein KefG
MSKVLILFAHPALEKSRVHNRLISRVKNIQDVHVHDLYELYPDFDIDVKKEQKLLLEYNIIIWQHPFYWYSAPAIIKQWMDLVLEHNWAYGPEGNFLMGKKIFNAISTGGSSTAYSTQGRNRYSIRDLLAPFEQTARLCKMEYLPSFVIHDTHKLKKEEIETFAEQYEQLLLSITTERLDNEAMQNVFHLNDLVSFPELI